METHTPFPPLVAQKLEIFEQLQPEFEQLFLFAEQVQGQQRFATLTVADVVRYLHALWMEECRTSLLSISKTVKEYAGQRCLDLLQHWQINGDTASVVDFLTHKLDMLSLVEITRRMQEARTQQGENGPVQRLVHGQRVMLNRSMNLLLMLDAIFSLSPQELTKSVHAACQRYGHLPEQIEQQRAAMQSPLYAYMPHQILAERNILLMNTLGRQITSHDLANTNEELQNE
ncbi:hypothetical protein KDI_16740 [Dictyobacter arantiisoli]|uniref:Uncharacterized protein n=2 Tax=Dictyobacter arantiisoli TaxID=2014874 RepID=A0A5A5T9D8_9CHLR|nr:hypothetical protein KDI_16740 [Dictyobacter arantiisoli]